MTGITILTNNGSNLAGFVQQFADTGFVQSVHPNPTTGPDRIVLGLPGSTDLLTITGFDFTVDGSGALTGGTATGMRLAFGPVQHARADGYSVPALDMLQAVLDFGPLAVLGLMGTINFRGGTGADLGYGAGGNDVLIGGFGNDRLSGGPGADILEGGAGIDTVLYDTAARGVTVNLGRPDLNAGDAAGDLYLSIENLHGSSFNDVLVGDARNNVISGRLGDDAILAGLGTDTLIGGAGADRFVFNRRGEGRDIIADFTSVDAVQINAIQFGGGLIANVALQPRQLVIDGPINGTFGQFHFRTASGTLFWDPDGVGPNPTEAIARFAPPVTLDVTDFLIR